MTVDQNVRSILPDYYSYPLIVPFNADMDNSARNIYYRTTNHYQTMDRIYRDISNVVSHGIFYPSEAIIVTYDNIPRYRYPSIKFKYQVILATDYTSTYAIVNYERLDTSGNRIGYGDPSCHAFQNFTSGGRNQTELTKTSNIGIPGRHLYVLTEQRCISK